MSLQTDYNLYMEEAYAGMIENAYPNKNTISRAAEEAIAFGLGVVRGTDPEKQCRLPKLDNAKLVFDADFVTSNTINLKVNGVAITEVTFDTDHDTTAGLLVNAIAALTGVTCILDSADANNRTFLIEAEGTDIAVTDVVVAAGASQAGSTVTYSTDDVFIGVARHEHKMSNLINEVNYKVKEAVNVLNEGGIWVYTTEAVAVDDTAYLVAAAGDDRGKFNKTSSGNIATSGVFKRATSGAGLTILKIRLL